MTQNTHFSFSELRKYWKKTSMKPYRANTKSCSSMSATWGFSFTGLSWFFLTATPHTSLSLATSKSYMNLSLQVSQSLGISIYSYLKMQLRLHFMASCKEVS